MTGISICLNSRGIKTETVHTPNFKGTVGQENIHSTKHNRTFEDTVFPIKNDFGVIGLDVRNNSRVGSFKHAASGSKRSLVIWCSSEPKVAERLYIVESPLDAYSHFQMNPAKNQNSFYICIT